jgi:hypothetical protein
MNTPTNMGTMQGISMLMSTSISISTNMSINRLTS